MRVHGVLVLLLVLSACEPNGERVARSQMALHTVVPVDPTPYRGVVLAGGGVTGGWFDGGYTLLVSDLQGFTCRRVSAQGLPGPAVDTAQAGSNARLTFDPERGRVQVLVESGLSAEEVWRWEADCSGPARIPTGLSLGAESRSMEASSGATQLLRFADGGSPAIVWETLFDDGGRRLVTQLDAPGATRFSGSLGQRGNWCIGWVSGVTANTVVLDADGGVLSRNAFTGGMPYSDVLTLASRDECLVMLPSVSSKSYRTVAFAPDASLSLERDFSGWFGIGASATNTFALANPVSFGSLTSTSTIATRSAHGLPGAYAFLWKYLAGPDGGVVLFPANNEAFLSFVALPLDSQFRDAGLPFVAAPRGSAQTFRSWFPLLDAGMAVIHSRTREDVPPLGLTVFDRALNASTTHGLSVFESLAPLDDGLLVSGDRLLFELRPLADGGWTRRTVQDAGSNRYQLVRVQEVLLAFGTVVGGRLSVLRFAADGGLVDSLLLDGGLGNPALAADLTTAYGTLYETRVPNRVLRIPPTGPITELPPSLGGDVLFGLNEGYCLASTDGGVRCFDTNGGLVFQGPTSFENIFFDGTSLGACSGTTFFLGGFDASVSFDPIVTAAQPVCSTFAYVAPGEARWVEPRSEDSPPVVKLYVHRLTVDRDAGAAPDAGQADAGQADAGQADAGQTDAGQTDAGQEDAGQADAGQADAGQTDAGQSDAGQADAGQTDDAGESPDSGTISSDGGNQALDAGPIGDGSVELSLGCGCTSAASARLALLLWGAPLVGLRRRRSRRSANQ